MATNTYPDICASCKEPVAPGEGLVNGKLADGSWHVTCPGCIPDATPSGPAPKDYWRKTIVRRIRVLVEELERLEPEEIDMLRATPQAALLREWLGKAPKLEFDL